MAIPLLGGMATVRPPPPKAAPPGPPPARRYTLDDSFFKSALDEAIREALFSPISLGERHIIKLKPKFDTACWAYLPPHRMYFGTDLFEKEVVKLGLSDDLQRKYVRNHYHHELAHALYTERDLQKVKLILEGFKAPFQLWNLFEDANIEDRYRRDTEYKFEWRLMEDGDFNERPESLLFALIQREGSVADVATDLAAWTYDSKKSGKPDGDRPIDLALTRFAPSVKALLEAWLPKVALYYKRTVAAVGSLSLMPIIKAWVEEFGIPAQPSAGLSCDLGLGHKFQVDPDALAEFDATAKPLEEPPKGGCKPKLADGEDEPDKPTSQKGTVLDDEESFIDMVRVAKVVAKLKKFFEETSRRVSTLTPQKRISARHFATGRSPFRVSKRQGRGIKTVLIVVDCSGSMSGYHMEEGRILVAALSELARMGIVIGHVVFTGVAGRGKPIHETYALPVQMSTIARAQGMHGAEGLEAAIRENIVLAKQADYVYVYTDANITDQVIKKSQLHAQGVYTWGLYAGSEKSFQANLLAYFDKAVLREDAEQLVDAMLAQNK